VFRKTIGSARAVIKLDQIIDKCISGDVKSKEWLYKFFYGYIMAITIRYITKTHVAEELVNDSFIKIFNHLHHFKFPDESLAHLKAFKGWMARITSRTAIDFLRIDKNHYHIEELADEDIRIDPINVINKIQFEEILALLNELPEIQRIIFNMFEIEGYSHEEISQSLNIPLKNSRVYLARAKSRLRLAYQRNFERIENAS